MFPKKFKSKVLETKNISPSVKQIKFLVEKDFEFLPGQYVSVLFKHQGNHIARAYSIASSPNSKNFIELCVKKIEGGIASNYLFSLKKNDNVELLGPLGSFKLKDKIESIFICVGTGIAPFKSMIPFLLKQEFDKKIILIKATRYEEDILYNEEFEELSKKHKNFEVHNILSRPRTNKFEKGYVQDFLEKFIPNNFKGNFYICGLSPMIDAVKQKLTKLGFSENQINYERYD